MLNIKALKRVIIETGEIYQGALPKKAARIVCEWCIEHKEELLEDWELAIKLQPLFRISGADND